MDTQFYMGLGIGLLGGAFVITTVWYVEVMFGKSKAAQRAREAFDVSQRPSKSAGGLFAGFYRS